MLIQNLADDCMKNPKLHTKLWKFRNLKARINLDTGYKMVLRGEKEASAKSLALCDTSTWPVNFIVSMVCFFRVLGASGTRSGRVPDASWMRPAWTVSFAW
uniref:Uncharacterized protein n=1 Tax=Romanomermis culicivorax TaxID=13658 RepID=A0A915JZ71_ROMCU